MKLRPLLRTGFTLIELLIVVAIVGVLTALITTNLQGARSRARDTRRKSDLRAVEQSLRLYYNDAKQFPVSDASYQITGCGTIALPTVCSWGSSFSTSTSVYMSLLPTDPSSTVAVPLTYQYYSVSDDAFILVAKLENLSDPDIADSQSRCAGPYAGITGDITRDYVVCAQ